MDNPDRLQHVVKVAIIGMGAMGKGLFYQCYKTPGIKCVAVCDIKIEQAVSCAKWLKQDYFIASNVQEVNDTIRKGMIAICEDGDLLARCEQVDALIEASSSIIPAGRHSLAALQHDKHLILMNAEVDLIFGPYLLKIAGDHDVIYTSCDGDQHGVLKRLIDDLQLWGFELVMAGNMKGFLDRYSNPTKIIPEADKRNLDYKMATAYTDGSKLCIEMALLANNLGLSTITPGMFGPKANHVHDVFQLYDFEKLWKDRQPFVDYILGAQPDGGVFAIGYCDDDYQKSMLTYYKMGKGPFYLFYRPYHLCHIEAMDCILSAVHKKKSLLHPVYGFRTNVFAYAKRNMRQGERLDGIGGYNCYGLIENCIENNNHISLPLCLAEDITLKRDIKQDEKINLQDVSYDPDRFDFTTYHQAVNLSKQGV
jgi:predicted homoserine dehydrogenase-like protein